jgi:hypothetical protein
MPSSRSHSVANAVRDFRFCSFRLKSFVILISKGNYPRDASNVPLLIGAFAKIAKSDY